MKSKALLIQPQDDLFMLTQSLYLHLHKEEMLASVKDLSEHSSVLEFWENVFSDKHWGKMQVFCENLEYDALKECICRYDMNHLVWNNIMDAFHNVLAFTALYKWETY